MERLLQNVSLLMATNPLAILSLNGFRANLHPFVLVPSLSSHSDGSSLSLVCLFLPHSHIYSKIEYSLLPVLLAMLNQALCFPALCEGVCKV